MPKPQFVPSRLITALTMHTTLRATEGSESLNLIMDKLVENVYLGDGKSGYMQAKISDESCSEIWRHYQKLYTAIRNASYEYNGELTYLIELKKARNDEAFQIFLNKSVGVNSDSNN